MREGSEIMIQYPKGLKRKQAPLNSTSKTIDYSRRGMRLETMINEANEYYLSRGRAVIHKKPTPVRIAKVDYPKRSAAKITEAYFTEASTTDYNGVYSGYYVDFEAKETKNKTSFPLKNFHQHQINHMKACAQQGGLCFAILWFSTLEKGYLLPFDILESYWNNQATGRKSIPLSIIEEDGYPCTVGLFPSIDYLSALEAWLHNE